MTTQPTHETAFIQYLDVIHRAAMSISRRHGLRGADADDFASSVKLRLIEDEYAVIRKFRGESSMSTYLTVVIAMLFRDYRFQRWGRWRPSALARRKGELAVRLETLVRRDGLSLDEAAEWLRTAGHTDLPTRELGRLLNAIPSRPPLRPVDVGPEALVNESAPGGARDPAVQAELVETRTVAERIVDDALAALPPEDAAILRLRFHEGLTVADVARTLQLEQKPLYRRIEHALVLVRRHLESRGVSAEVVRDILDEPAPHSEGV